MTHKTALTSFNRMQAQILADGAGDTDEAQRLKDFIYPYVLGGNMRFVEFDKLISKYLEDGQITAEESAELVKLIGRISYFLKIDNFVYNAMMISFICFVVGVLAFKLFA